MMCNSVASSDCKTNPQFNLSVTLSSVSLSLFLTLLTSLMGGNKMWAEKTRMHKWRNFLHLEWQLGLVQLYSFVYPPAGSLSAHHYFHTKPSELCCLVVDSGFSFTHIAPYCRSKKLKEGIHRSEHVLLQQHEQQQQHSQPVVFFCLSGLMWVGNC